MSSTYMPSNDGAFSAWAQQFLTYVAGHEAELGITAAQVAALGDMQTAWGTAYIAHTAARTATIAA